MAEYALFFKAGGPILGEGYVAVVRLQGRVLAVRTAEEFEMYGVNPGDPAVFAPTLAEAYAELVEEIRIVLVDIASDGRTFEKFRREAKEFFSATDAPTRARWDEARARARRGEIGNDLGLRIQQDDPPIGIEIDLVQEPTPMANPPPQDPTRWMLAA